MNLTSDHILKVPVVQRPEYTISLEQPNPETTFTHCLVHVPWTPRVKRQLQGDWAEVKRLHGGPLYLQISPENTKLQRFARLFGFHPELTLTDLTTGRSQLIFRTKD